MLFAVSKSGATIALPEVVQLEVSHKIAEQGANAIEAAEKSIGFLRQLTQQKVSAWVPSEESVRDAIGRRWEDLSGTLQPMPLTIEHSKAGLNRIIKKLPPCNANNEQFRDSCIWQCALELSDIKPVYLISNDHAFYEGGRKRENGLANELQVELDARGRKVKLYPDLGSFLSAIGGAKTLGDKTVEELVVAAVTSKSKEVAENPHGGASILGKITFSKITGYATPRINVVAISFTATYRISSVKDYAKIEKITHALLTVTGSASFDPQSNSVTDVSFQEWSKRLQGTEGTVWHAPSYKEQLLGCDFQAL